MAGPLLDVCDDPPCVGLVPAPVQLLGGKAELHKEVIRASEPPMKYRRSLPFRPSGVFSVILLFRSLEFRYLWSRFDAAMAAKVMIQKGS